MMVNFILLLRSIGRMKLSNANFLNLKQKFLKKQTLQLYKIITMAYFKISIIALLCVLARCEPPTSGYNYPQPSNSYNHYNNGGNNYNRGGYEAPSNAYIPSGESGHDYNHHDHHGHHENQVPKSYEFGYAVKDAESGNDYHRHETSDGNVVRGEYRVQLPDGRTQIVTYHADWKTGFHADVRYEGEARYPEVTHNHHNNGGYNYNSPDYSGSLTGFQGHQGYKPQAQPHGSHSYY